MPIGRTSLAWSDWALIAFGAILVLIGLLIGGIWLVWLDGVKLWHARWPAGGQAGPLSYDGRQYVVIAAGGHSLETKIGDSVIAYALPAR
jgi:hypothetical protein